MLMIAGLELWQLSGVHFILCSIQLFMIIMKIEIEGFDSGAKLITEHQLQIGVQQWCNSCEFSHWPGTLWSTCCLDYCGVCGPGHPVSKVRSVLGFIQAAQLCSG